MMNKETLDIIKFVMLLAILVSIFVTISFIVNDYLHKRKLLERSTEISTYNQIWQVRRLSNLISLHGLDHIIPDPDDQASNIKIIDYLRRTYLSKSYYFEPNTIKIPTDNFSPEMDNYRMTVISYGLLSQMHISKIKYSKFDKSRSLIFMVRRLMKLLLRIESNKLSALNTEEIKNSHSARE